MLTIFTIPKGFVGQTAIHQRNALQSWKALGDGVEVFLCGDDPGVAETAREFGVGHVSAVEKTPLGTPLLSSAFARVGAAARFDRLCYVNADIMLTSSFRRAARVLPEGEFLGVCQRVNLDWDSAVDFGAPDWELHLDRFARSRGQPGLWSQIDGFVFRRTGPLATLPAFAVGRPGWDNWFIWNARHRGIPVVDMSPQTLLLHQNHGYGHVKGGSGQAWEGPEAEENRRLMGGDERKYTMADATHVLTRWGAVPAVDPLHLRVRAAKFALGNPLLRGPARWAQQVFQSRRSTP